MVHNLLINYKDIDLETWKEFAAGWNAILYRLRACKDYSEEFIRSIQNASNAPPPDDRYVQEKSLFGFFMNGLSAIESACYALYAIGALINLSAFPFSTEKEKKKICPTIVYRLFKKAYPTASITVTLKNLFGDQKESINADSRFIRWESFRNKLAHRISPPRHIFSGGENDGKALWLGINLDENTTHAYYDWLILTVNRLIQNIRQFVEDKVRVSK